MCVFALVLRKDAGTSHSYKTMGSRMFPQITSKITSKAPAGHCWFLEREQRELGGVWILKSIQNDMGREGSKQVQASMFFFPRSEPILHPLELLRF